MTSFIIQAHEGRAIPESWNNNSRCVFCSIINGDTESYRLFENDKVIAILDIQPLRPGHTLVIPKLHCPRVSELPPEYAAATGEAVSKVAHALTEVLENTALNVVCNQEYAQAVPHVHYHIIPAPKFTSDVVPRNVDHVVAPLTQKEMHKLEFKARGELDEEQAQKFAQNVRARL